MPCSPAQLEANRKNAQLSTGPRTEEGKSVSRRNSLKHGLTGSGVVLPTEDAAEVERRFDALEAEMAPRSELARHLVARVALMTLRLDRAALDEAKSLARRMSKAASGFDDARLAEVEKAYSWIAHEPSTNVRRMKKHPEGVDRLINGMEGLKEDLCHPDGKRWSWGHCEHLHHLMGLRAMDVPITRARALCEAVFGDPKYLGPEDAPGLRTSAREEWAVEALAAFLESEIEALKAFRATIDLEKLERERREAPESVIFDESKNGVLARKYEASSERALYRALREFREVQLEASGGSELGSSLPEGDGTEVVGGESDVTSSGGSNFASGSSRPGFSGAPTGSEGVSGRREGRKGGYRRPDRR